MTYKDIRTAINTSKRAHQNEKMCVDSYGDFSVMYSDKATGIIVDTDIAKKIALRRWCIDSGGYPIANISGCAVRLADYVMATQFDYKPDGCFVDHINGDRLDNRRRNLRFVTPEDNSFNVTKQRNNKTGVIGVWKTQNGRFRAYISKNKKRYELGEYDTLEKAATVRRKAEQVLGMKEKRLIADAFDPILELMKGEENETY